MNKTKIDWCDYTWNPVWGCRNSCPYCYARALAHRWGKSFDPHWMPDNFNSAMPKKPARIFVNSMSDICFWEKEWIEKVLDRIEEYPQHKFLFLSKTAEIYHAYDPWPINCWLGATATTQMEITVALSLLDDLPAIHFLSIEPILEQIDPTTLRDYGLEWVILGAETGNRRERIVPPPEWIAPFMDLSIPLFMKKNLPWPGPWRRECPA